MYDARQAAESTAPSSPSGTCATFAFSAIVSPPPAVESATPVAPPPPTSCALPTCSSGTPSGSTVWTAAGRQTLQHGDTLEVALPSSQDGSLSVLTRRLAARATGEEILLWLERRLLKYFDANPTALSEQLGGCPSYLRWAALERELTNKFGRISKELSVILRNGVFHNILGLIRPGFCES